MRLFRAGRERSVMLSSCLEAGSDHRGSMRRGRGDGTPACMVETYGGGWASRGTGRKAATTTTARMLTGTGGGKRYPRKLVVGLDREGQLQGPGSTSIRVSEDATLPIVRYRG